MRISKLLFLIVIGASVSTLKAAPVIGINIDASGDSVDHTRLNLSATYVDAVTSAGGIPLILPPARDARAIDRYVELCDGFLMTGGPDIPPDRYGDDPVHPTARLMNSRRENFDFALINAVLESGKPILGVCLGFQEINVALGGSMIQDLPSQTSSTIDHRPNGHPDYAHDIQVTTGTLLQDILGTTTLQVNSIHHQACDRLGSGILVMARAPDGIVESFRVENKNFALGVQWHPEKLTTAPEHLAVYQALIDAAEKNVAEKMAAEKKTIEKPAEKTVEKSKVENSQVEKPRVKNSGIIITDSP